MTESIPETYVKEIQQVLDSNPEASKYVDEIVIKPIHLDLTEQISHPRYSYFILLVDDHIDKQIVSLLAVDRDIGHEWDVHTVRVDKCGTPLPFWEGVRYEGKRLVFKNGLCESEGTLVTMEKDKLFPLFNTRKLVESTPTYYLVTQTYYLVTQAELRAICETKWKDTVQVYVPSKPAEVVHHYLFD